MIGGSGGLLIVYGGRGWSSGTDDVIVLVAGLASAAPAPVRVRARALAMQMAPSRCRFRMISS
jgi:hypothetical protein